MENFATVFSLMLLVGTIMSGVYVFRMRCEYGKWQIPSHEMPALVILYIFMSGLAALGFCTQGIAFVLPALSAFIVSAGITVASAFIYIKSYSLIVKNTH